MNPCGTSGDQQPGGISWASDNWEHPSGVICNFQDFGGHFQTTRPADQWEWDNAMVFPLINQTANSSHHGNNIEQKPTIFASSPGTDSRHFSGSLPFPSYSNFFPQNTPLNVWNQMGSVHNFGNFESIQNIHPADQFFHSEQVLGSGIPGLAATNAMTNMRSFDQRRHFLNIMDFEQKNIGELFPGRIGLNLAMGGRTYFSAEDSAAARLAKRPRSSSPAHVQMPMCQAEGCTADLSRSKHYHRRHKVCEFHSKAPSVMANAQTQRFCQQCSRFHVLSEFDEAKRSCRKRLADHNRRRRKPQPSTIISDENPLAQSFALKSEEHNLLQSSKLITVTAADATSMIQLHLKKTSSPSASTEDQLNDQRSSSSPLIDFPLINASSSCFGRSGDEKPSVSKHSFRGSNNSTGITQTSDSHELLIHDAAQNYESIHMHHGHERSLMFQNYLQEIASTGPNLSLSTMSGDLGMDTRAGLRLSTHYNEENNIAASWRKPEAGILAHDFPAQSLMRPRSSLECMRGSISYQEQGQERLRSSTSSSSFQGVIEGHSILSLSKTSPCRETGVRVHQSTTLQQSAVALEFQEQQFDDADDVMEIQLQPVKFSDLQSLRPFGSCVYD